MGALPDMYVPESSVTDWEAVFDLARSSGWTWEYSEGDVTRLLPSAAEVLSRPVDVDSAYLRVWPVPDVLAIFYPMSADEIDFDVDLRELQGQGGVDLLCDFLGAIGRRLGKQVVMTSGGDYGNPVLGFDPTADRVVVLADPQLIELVGPATGGAGSDE
jgi:hypothetical protein